MNRIKCPSCGLVNFDSEATCRRCHQDLFAMSSAPPAYQSPITPPAYYQAPDVQPQAAPYGASPAQAAPYPAPPVPPAAYSVPPAQTASYTAPAAIAQPPQYAPYYPMPTKRREGLAITSLVLGCIGFFSWGLCGIGSIVGLVMGIIALNKANKLPMEYGGKGLAIAGIATNGLVFATVPIIAAIAIPNLMASRMAANEAAAINQLRKIAAAEATYQSRYGPEYGTLEQLVQAGLLEPTAGGKNGYSFSVVPSSNRDQFRHTTSYTFEAHAVPMSYGSSGKRSFSVTDAHDLRGADNKGRRLQGEGQIIQSY